MSDINMKQEELPKVTKFRRLNVTISEEAGEILDDYMEFMSKKYDEKLTQDAILTLILETVIKEKIKKLKTEEGEEL